MTPKAEIQRKLDIFEQQIDLMKRNNPGIESRNFTADIIAAKEKQTLAEEQLRVITEKESTNGYLSTDELHDPDKRSRKKDELRNDIKKYEKEVSDLVQLQSEFNSLINARKRFSDRLAQPDQLSVGGSTKKSTPFGPKDVPIDHFKSVTTAPDWKEWNNKFCTENKVTSNSDTKNNKLTYTFTDTKETIEVAKDRVSAKIDKNSNLDKVLPAMVDLYLKSIDGKNVTSHTIVSNNPDIQSRLEKELATKLQELGIKDAKINGKEVDDIAPKPPQI